MEQIHAEKIRTGPTSRVRSLPRVSAPPFGPKDLMT
jgi:hypothetical protein